MIGQRREDLVRDHVANRGGEDSALHTPNVRARQQLLELGSSDPESDRQLRQFHAGTARLLEEMLD